MVNVDMHRLVLFDVCVIFVGEIVSDDYDSYD